MRALQKFVVVLLGLGLSSTTAWADDTDGDLVDDAIDNCPVVSNSDQADSDCDGEGDACQSPDHACLSCCDAPPPVDDDGDGVTDDRDNCIAYNPDQADSDCDGLGDECDFIVDDGFCGDDGDAIDADQDNCPDIFNPDQLDADCDGIGDECDADDGDHVCDADGDAVPDDVDTCPDVPNADRQTTDTDCDDVADDCDPDLFDSICDLDLDGIADAVDTCPTVANASGQADDIDCDGVADACDADSHDGLCGDHDYDGDGVPEALDVCPDDDATGHDLYTDGCVDTIYDFSPFIRTLGITKRSAETALTVVADSAADSLERGQPLVAALKLRALNNLAKALNRVAFITNDQYGLIVRFSGDIDADI